MTATARKLVRRALLLVLVAVTGLVAVVLVRFALFSGPDVVAAARPAAPPMPAADDLPAQRLGQAVRFRTVADRSGGPADAAQFDGLRAFLAASFPLVHARLELETVSEHSLLFRWRGSDPELSPVLFLGHQDVVPADDGNWSVPPFEGRVDEEHVWGRGALDDKAGVMGMLEATERLLARGYQPRRGIYFAFGHDEEISGFGAAAIAKRLAAEGVRFEFIIDEGMNIMDGAVDGLAIPVALIGTAGKGYLSVRLRATAQAGHTAIPPRRTAIGALAAAIHRLENAPLPAEVSPPLDQMFEVIGPHMNPLNRLAMANLWLFEGFIVAQLESAAQGNAILRTTTAPAIISGGSLDNVLPSEATAVVNFRIHPRDSIASITAHVRRTVGADIQVEPLLEHAAEPSLPLRARGRGYQTVVAALGQVYPRLLASPSLFIGLADIRHYTRLSDELLMFRPLWMTPADLPRLHGVDERIDRGAYAACIAFYEALLQGAGDR